MTQKRRRTFKKNHSNEEPRGKVHKENRVFRAFWIRHKMDDIITKSGADLDQTIDAFLQKWQDDHLEENPGWWYPSIAGMHEMRYSKEYREKKKGKGLTL